MKKKNLKVSIFLILMFTLASSVISVRAEYIGVESDDEIRYAFKVNRSGEITEKEFVMKVVSVEDVPIGKNITVEYTSEDADLQESLDYCLSIWGDSFVILEDSVGPIYDASDPYGDEYDIIYLYFWAMEASTFDPSKFIVNTNFEQKYADEIKEDGGESGAGALIEYDEDGVLKEVQSETYDYNFRNKFEKRQILRLENKIPGYPLALMAFAGIASVCTLLVIWRKRNH